MRGTFPGFSLPQRQYFWVGSLLCTVRAQHDGAIARSIILAISCIYPPLVDSSLPASHPLVLPPQGGEGGPHWGITNAVAAALHKVGLGVIVPGGNPNGEPVSDAPAHDLHGTPDDDESDASDTRGQQGLHVAGHQAHHGSTRPSQQACPPLPLPIRRMNVCICTHRHTHSHECTYLPMHAHTCTH